MVESKDILLPLVAALWALCTLLFAVAREVNTIRDKVLSGRDAGGNLKRRHLEVLVTHDWKPLSLAIQVLAWVFCAIASIAPFSISGEKRSCYVIFVAVLVALYSAFMGVAWRWGAHRDLKEMSQAIRDHVDPPPNLTTRVASDQPKA